MATSPLHKLFTQSDALARLRDHANRLVRLQRTLDANLPAATQGAARVANLQAGELTLHVRSPAMATRIKLTQERLLASLQASGEPVQTMKIKVRAMPFGEDGHPEETAVRPIGRQGRAALEHLADDLRDDDPLARALRNMLARSQRG